MSETVPEPAREIPVLEDVDVVVAGGGVAGCAAAYGAGKAGARTILAERNGCLGGVATATLMANIGNCYLTGDGRQVTHGFAGALVDRLIAEGAATELWRSREVPGVVVDSEKLKVVLIEMLEEVGVTILTHALGARPIMAGTVVNGVFLESKSGREAVLARTVIDATGEADLAWQAGAEVRFKPGTASTLFKLANVDIDRFVEFLGEDPDGFPAGMDLVKDYDTFARNWRERGILFFPHGGGKNWRFLKALVEAGTFPSSEGPARSLNALGMYGLRGTGFLVINSNFYRIENYDVRELSKFEVHAQKMCYLVAEAMRDSIPGFEESVIAHIGVDLGVRSGRAIVGRTTLPSEHVSGATEPFRCDEVIGLTTVHETGGEGGRFFTEFGCDVPFGVTVPTGCENLLVASGKSVSTERIGILRGMSRCMLCGHAAGVAAALGAGTATPAADVPIRDLQRELLNQGAHLGEAERLEELGLAELGLA